VEIAVAVARKSIDALARREVAAVMSLGVAYVAAIRAFAPDYITHILPLLRQTYWAFGHLTWFGLVSESIQLHVLAVVTIGAAVLVRQLRPLTVALLVAGIAGIIGYYLQRTGWYYQQLPALTFLTFALALLVIDIVHRRPVPLPRWTPAAAMTICVITVALTAHFMGYPFTPDRSFPIDTPDPSFFAGLQPGTPVATLTTTVDYTVPPVFKYHLILAQRYPHLWMLPAILRSESGEHAIPPQQLAHLDQLQHDAMLQDFLRWQPRLVLVERCQDPDVHCQVLEHRHDNLLGWFLRDAQFCNLFSRYRYTRSAGPFDAYVLK
jgi:hypothetical protein